MKHLHFYIQCLMLLLALSIAVRIPLDNMLAIYVVWIELILGAYQLFLSCILVNRLSRPSALLRTHCYVSWIYLTGLLLLGITSPSWMSKTLWEIALWVIPWGVAVFFLVVIDDLEHVRKYRL